MIIDGIRIEIMEFENLYEYLKPCTSHYILKYIVDKNEALYYMVEDSANYVLFAYCFDKNFSTEYVRIENGKVFPSETATGTTIVLATVAVDSLLETLLAELSKPEPKKPKIKVKKK